jgi:hypothetical protein
MAYIRRWRKYHAVVASLAQSSDEEVLPYQNISHPERSSIKSGTLSKSEAL